MKARMEFIEGIVKVRLNRNRLNCIPLFLAIFLSCNIALLWLEGIGI